MHTSQTSGYCISCGRDHSLPLGPAKDECNKLMQYLQKNQRIDYLSAEPANNDFSTANLFGTDRGKMFGVLTGCDQEGKHNSVRLFRAVQRSLAGSRLGAAPL